MKNSAKIRKKKRKLGVDSQYIYKYMDKLVGLRTMLLMC